MPSCSLGTLVVNVCVCVCVFVHYVAANGSNFVGPSFHFKQFDSQSESKLTEFYGSCISFDVLNELCNSLI